MFEMIMTINKTLCGKIFVLKISKNCFTNDRKKVFFTSNACFLFVVSEFIASGDI